MARPTNRKEWLEKFLYLAGANKPARQFRTQLGIKLSAIPSEISKLSQYKAELDKIKEDELKTTSKKKKPKYKQPKLPEDYLAITHASSFGTGSGDITIVPASG